MKLYADTPARLTRQLLGDVLFGLWIYLWVQVAQSVHSVTMRLAAPGELTERSARSLGENLTDAGSYLEGLPLVGSGAAAPFDRAAEATRTLADAGRDSAQAVADLAWWLQLCVALVPVVAVAAVYLPSRARFVRRAAAARRLSASGEDLDLLALRALASQPLDVLARVSADPASGWRRADPAVIAALADLELRSCGLVVRRSAPAGTGRD